MFEELSIFSHIVWDFSNLFRIFGMCLGGSYRSSGATFVTCLKICKMLQKVFGKVQEGPRSPPDPLKDIYLSMTLYFCFYLFSNCLLHCLLYCLSNCLLYCRLYCLSHCPWVSGEYIKRTQMTSGEFKLNQLESNGIT